jgi:hypothetical protein
MQNNFRSFLIWCFKRYIWQILFATSFIASIFLAPFAIQCSIAAVCLFRIGLDLWNYMRFKSYEMVDSKTHQPKTWQSILKEFRLSKGNLAAYAFNRDDISNQIELLMNQGKIKQTEGNNLCGPIAFLNFLIKHNPALFVKTACEYFENGSTYSPFYFQSSFWDRYAYFPPIYFFNQFFYSHYITPAEALAGAIKNTHNLMGYNNSCLFELFKGSTEPKILGLLLEQAGYKCTSNVTTNNYNNNGEMAWVNRVILGGLYNADNNSKPLKAHRKDKYCYFTLSQEQGNSTLHYAFNVAAGHWQFKNKKNDSNNCIQIHLPHKSKLHQTT